jgi:hypothetical protein
MSAKWRQLRVRRRRGGPILPGEVEVSVQLQIAYAIQ